MNTLLLTDTEKELFLSLPDAVREGWSVEAAGELREESLGELSFRLRMTNVHDLALQSIIVPLQKETDIVEAAKKIDFSTLSPIALGELCFVLGVRVMTAMILHALTDATTDEDVEGIAGLSHMRASLSELNTPAS